MKAKIELALERLMNVKTQFNDSVFIGHSGGKDSVVIHHLAKQVFDNLIVIHNAKCLEGTGITRKEKQTEVYVDTLKFIYSNVIKETPVLFLSVPEMEQWIQKLNLKVQIDGSRMYEYTRKDKSSTYVKDGLLVSRTDLTEFQTNGLFGLNISYPIFNWTDQDVWDYIFFHKLEVSNEYQENGEYQRFKSLSNF